MTIHICDPRQNSDGSYDQVSFSSKQGDDELVVVKINTTRLPDRLVLDLRKSELIALGMALKEL